jgi:uncharacterized protein YegL
VARTGSNLDLGKDLVGRVLDQMNRTSDEAALFTFDRVIRRETSFTDDPDDIRRALAKTTARGLTSLYDAIAETAKQVAARRSHRRAAAHR